MAVTIGEIAKRANVSTATVSYVLNNKGNIPEATRERIRNIIQESSFQPNNNARNLATGKNLRIGIFTPSAEYLRRSVFFAEIASAILPEINQYGMDLVIEVYNSDPDRWLRNVNSLDGAILINPGGDDDHLEWLRSSQKPVVVIGNPGKSSDLTYVDGPNVEMACSMTEKVLEAGHRNLLYILPLQHYTLTQDFLLGIEKAIEDSGEKVRTTNLYTAYGKEITEEWLRDALVKADGASAIVVDSDYKAVRVMDCLINMGKKIPDDYSLVCLSGSYLTQIPTPKICSSNPDNAEIGKMAARELLNLINGKESPKDSNICSGYSLEEGGTLAFYKGKN